MTRDNVSGLEVDSILEFSSGEYAAIEIKLGFDQVEEAKKSLIKFSENMLVKPKRTFTYSFWRSVVSTKCLLIFY